jgi:hypothetical protein
LPDGTEVQVLVPERADLGSGPEEDGPVTAEEMARVLAAMDRLEPLEMSEQERQALEAARQARKAWAKAHFDEHAAKLRGIGE